MRRRGPDAASSRHWTRADGRQVHLLHSRLSIIDLDERAKLLAGLAGSGFRPGQVAGVGDLGGSILAQVPDAFKAQVEPFIPAIVEAIHQAFSIATANTFLIGIVATLLAAGLVAVWVERVNGLTSAAGAVSVGTSAPTSTQWNLAVIELRR